MLTYKDKVQIIDMRKDGLSYRLISEYICKPEHEVEKYGQSVAITRRPVKRGKYDHLFEEEVNHGLNYNEYVQNQGPNKIRKIA